MHPLAPLRNQRTKSRKKNGDRSNRKEEDGSGNRMEMKRNWPEPIPHHRHPPNPTSPSPALTSHDSNSRAQLKNTHAISWCSSHSGKGRCSEGLFISLLPNGGREYHNVSGLDSFVFHEPVPTPCEHEALAALPVTVPELPRPHCLIVKHELHVIGGAVVLRRRVESSGEEFERVFLRDDQPVQFPDVARSQFFLEELFENRTGFVAGSGGDSDRLAGQGEGFAVVGEFGDVGAVFDHLEDLFGGELGLERGLLEGDGGPGEVTVGFAAPEANGGAVVSRRRVLLRLEGAQPYSLVVCVNLGPPVAALLPHHAFEPRRADDDGGRRVRPLPLLTAVLLRRAAGIGGFHCRHLHAGSYQQEAILHARIEFNLF
nr:hypothetical protein AXF42_Ash009526 [Ipomoea batatas]